MSSIPGFQIQVAYEVDEDVPVADVQYRGQQFADVRRVGHELRANFYELTSPTGAVPVEGLIEALRDAENQLS